MSMMTITVRRAATAAVWLARPVTIAFRPGYRLGRDGLKLLKDLPSQELVGTVSVAPEGNDAAADNRLSQELQRVRARSRRFGRFLGVILAADLIWWLKIVLFSGVSPLAPASVEKIAVAIVLGSQFLAFAHTNWQARTGRTGTIQELLSDGRAVWPR